jgi:hypothetical protein
MRSDDLVSGGELYTEDDFRQLVVTIEVRLLISAASAGLKIMASAVLSVGTPWNGPCGGGWSRTSCRRRWSLQRF